MTSYADNDGSGTIENEVQYTYNTAHGKLSRIYQSHQGAVNTMSTPNTWLGYDAAVDGNDVYTHAIRVQNEVYPLLTNAVLQRYYNTDSSIDGRLHRIRYIKLFDGNFLTGDVNQTNRYEYNGTGRVVRVESYASQIDVERTMATSTGVYGAWDRFGRTLQQKWFRSTTTHVDVKHGYDYAGNRLWREDVKAAANSEHHDEFYTYDGLQRLTDAQRGNLTGTYPDYTGVTSKNFEQEFTLDQLGNWPTFKHDSDGNGFDFTQTRTHNAVNELTEFTSTSWIDPVHDAAGNMTTMPQPLDPTDDFTAVYDAWNRMVEVKDGGATVLTNEYDGLNQRIVKDVTGGDTFEYYYNDQWQVNVETVEGAVEAIYAWHPYYIDALAVRFRATDRHAFLHDANFNVVAAYDIKSTSGTYRQVVERYQYSPYGEVTFLEPDFDPIVGNASAIGNNILYTGRERDPETGLQLNRERWYHAALGRWTQTDPFEYASASHNMYEYVYSRPTYFADPGGNVPVAVPIAIGGIGIAEGVAAGFGLSLAACMVHPPCAQAVADALGQAASDAANAVGSAAKTAVRTCRRARCKNRHPTWPSCPWFPYTDPVQAAGDTPAVEPGPGLGFKGIEKCKNVGAAKNCPGGASGTRYECVVVFMDKFGRVTRRAVGVNCCGCCNVFTEGVSCKAMGHLSNELELPEVGIGK